MEIIEQFILGKQDAETCEDSLVITDDYIAVVDGVTSSGDISFNGKRTGRVAAELISKVVAEMPSDLNIEEIITLINGRIEDFYSTSGFAGEKYINGPEAALGIYSKYHQKIWIIGDCQAIVNGKLFWSEKRLDKAIAEMRSLISNIDMCKTGQSEEEYFAEGDVLRPFVLDWVKKARIFANTEFKDFGYSVINGKEIPKSLIREIDVATGQNVVLATDGYPDLRESLVESESALLKIMAEDPFAINAYPQTKGLKIGNFSFDDRAFVKFKA